eukprot:11862966-Karenia_brevis.AAC.1
MSAGVPVIMPLIGLGDAFGAALSVTTAHGAFTKTCRIVTSRNSSSGRSPYVSAPVGLSDAS